MPGEEYDLLSALKKEQTHGSPNTSGLPRSGGNRGKADCRFSPAGSFQRPFSFLRRTERSPGEAETNMT